MFPPAPSEFLSGSLWWKANSSAVWRHGGSGVGLVCIPSTESFFFFQPPSQDYNILIHTVWSCFLFFFVIPAWRALLPLSPPPPPSYVEHRPILRQGHLAGDWVTTERNCAKYLEQMLRWARDSQGHRKSPVCAQPRGPKRGQAGSPRTEVLKSQPRRNYSWEKAREKMVKSNKGAGRKSRETKVFLPLQGDRSRRLSPNSVPSCHLVAIMCDCSAGCCGRTWCGVLPGDGYLLVPREDVPSSAKANLSQIQAERADPSSWKGLFV